MMHRVLDVLGRGPARLAKEGQEDEPPAVETGQESGQGAGPESDRPGYRSARPGIFEDRVLRPESRETDAFDADAGDRQGADHHHPEGDRDLFPERTIVTHVLLMVHGVDDRTRAEEQQRLEESVREEVEHRRAIDRKSVV